MKVADLFAELTLKTEGFDKTLGGLPGKSEGILSGIGLNAPTLLAGGLAAGGAAIAAGAIGSILNTEGAIDGMAAKLNLTEDDARDLGAVAKDVFRGNFGDSMGEVIDDITTIRSTLGEMTDKELQDFAEGALTIKDLWGPETDEIARTVKTMTGNFDDLSKSQALDLITTGFQNGGDFSGELLDTLNEYAPAFSNMGLNADEALGVLLAGADEGAFNLDKVGDAMKEFEIRTTDGSDASRAAFDALGMDADEMAATIANGGDEGKAAFATILAGLSQIEDPVERNKQGVALFGTTWEDLGEGVVLAMAEGSEGVGEFEGATKRASDQAYSNLRSTFQGIKREVLGAFSDAIGPAVLTAANFIQDPLIPTIRGFVELLSRNKPVVIGAFLGMAIAIGTVVVPAFLAWAATAGAAAAATILALLPVIAPILLIAGVAAALGLAWQTNFLGIRDITDEVIGFIVPLIEGAWEAIKLVTEEVIGLVSDLFAGDWAGAWERASGWVTSARDVIVEMLPKIWDAIKGFVTETIPKMATELAKWGAEMVAWIAPIIPPLLIEAGKFLAALAGWVLAKIPEIGLQLAKWGWEFIAWIGPQIPPLLIEAAKLLGELTGWIVFTALPELVSKLAEWGSAAIGWVAKDAAPFIVVELWKFANKINAWITEEALPAIVSSLITWGSAMFGWIARDAIPFIGEKLGNLLTKIKDWIVDEGVPGLVSAAADLGTGLVEGIWDGISASTEWLVGKLTEWVEDAIPGPVKKALELFSPSRVMQDIGVRSAMSLIPGMQSALPMVRGASEELGRAVAGLGGLSPVMDMPSAGGMLSGPSGRMDSGGGRAKIINLTLQNPFDPRDARTFVIDTVNSDVKERF